MEGNMSQGISAITWENVDDITVVRFTECKISETFSAREAGAELEKIAQQIGGKIVVDLANVQFMASVGISELITFSRSVRALGGHVKICSISPLLMQVFLSCGIDTVLEIHPTRVDALHAFRVGAYAHQGSATV
jgi:anti-anti-sigma factor